MQVIFLGTNGWYDTSTGNTISILLQTENYNIIFDAGNGIYKLNDYFPADKSEAYLFLSHFHLDHIGGLHVLCKFDCLKRLRIFGPHGTKDILKTFIDKPFTVPLSSLPYQVDMHELPEEKEELPFHLDTLPLLHADLTLGFRLETDGKTVCYCPDTGYCENAVKLAMNADLLITECSFKSGQDLPAWPHLNPQTAARIAKEAGAKKLVLAHFAANRYETMEEREEAAKEASKVFAHTIAGIDGMKIDV